MLKFRPIRELLHEAMDEVQEFSTAKELVKILGQHGEVTFSYQCFDGRIGWHTYLVMVEGAPVGYTNGIPDA